ncbi:hypothetical protein RRG08_035079 [Elysia crispata]|uniref:Uncharacterized protein n=1 Tax=Elysia crispata TaxID=231223 RepID=A0AAE0ZTB2_9GAST|nr:hypothetical protein RRG08_035079 [Elysia crispata]
MALLRRFFCWNLTTAVFGNFIAIVILSFGALLMRIIDLVAYATDFQISQGFQTQWRSHQWQAFLASDIIVTFTHVVIILYALYMLFMVTQKHFVLYMETLRAFTYTFIMYSFIEFCFSVFEFSFYGLNTFRRSYVVFLWLYWLARMLGNIGMVVLFFSRLQEIEEEMAYELRFSDRKYVHSYSALS